MSGGKRSFGFNLPFYISRCASYISLAIVLLVAINSWAGAGGHVSGTVKDASGAAVGGATLRYCGGSAKTYCATKYIPPAAAVDCRRLGYSTG